MIKSSIIYFLLLKKNIFTLCIHVSFDDIMIESIKNFSKTFFLMRNILEKTQVGGYFKGRVYVCVCRKFSMDKNGKEERNSTADIETSAAQR